MYETQRQLHWTEIKPLTEKPSCRWGQSSCVVGGEFVIFGGFADSQYLNDMWVFDSKTMEWTRIQTVGDVPQPRSNSSMNYYPQTNQLILFGGGQKDKTRYNTVYKLNWGTKQWTLVNIEDKNNQPEQRTYHTAEIIDCYLVIYGGQNITQLEDFWMMNLNTNQWQKLDLSYEDSKISARKFHSSTVANDQMFVISGCGESYGVFGQIWKIDFREFLKAKDFQKVSITLMLKQQRIERWGHTSSYNPIDGKIYIFGGRKQNRDLKNVIEYDINKNQTSFVDISSDTFVDGRRKHSSHFIGSCFVIFGGFNTKYFNDFHYLYISPKYKFIEIPQNLPVPFSRFFKEQRKQTVEFLQRYIPQFQQKYKLLKEEQQDESIDVIITSMLREYSMEYYANQQEIIKLQKDESFPQGQDSERPKKFFESLTDKIDHFRMIYKTRKVEQPPVLLVIDDLEYIPEKQYKKVAQVRSKVKKHKITDEKQKVINFSQKYNQLFNVLGVVSVRQKMFIQYLKDYQKIEKGSQITSLNPQDTGVLKNNNSQFYVEMRQKQRIPLDPKISYLNQFLMNFYKRNNKIELDNKTFEDKIMFYVAIMFIQNSVLVVPQNYELNQWIELAYFANYICEQNLVAIVEQILLQEVTIQKLDLFIRVAKDLKLKNLMEKCVHQVIKDKSNFFKKGIPKQKKQKIAEFNEFEIHLYQSVSKLNFSEDFKKMIKNQFEINRFNILNKLMNGKLQKKKE